MFKNKKAVIFDFDGTLADTLWAIRDASNITREKLGLSPITYEDVRLGINNGARNLVKATIVPEDKKNDEKYIDHAFELYNEAFFETYLNTDTPYDGIFDAVKELHSRGYKLAVLSNKTDNFVKDLVRNIFGTELIPVTRGPLRQDIVKPDPRLTLETLAELDPTLTPDDCVLIGDSDVDIATAKNAGMPVIGAAWGYRGRALLEEKGADVVIDTPYEIISLFN